MAKKLILKSWWGQRKLGFWRVYNLSRSTKSEDLGAFLPPIKHQQIKVRLDENQEKYAEIPGLNEISQLDTMWPHIVS